MKTVAVLGTGVVGTTLANGFAQLGYEVTIGSREVKEVKNWQGEVASFADAASSAELVVLAVKGEAAKTLVSELALTLKEKVVIDTTNPIDHQRQAQNGVLSFFTTLDKSLMEELQELAPEAKFVKAFNSVGSALMVNPVLNGQKPTMFICGNDQSAKEEVTKILDSFGWETEDFGSAASSRAIEPLCMLWCIPGFLKNDWMHAFKLLKQ